MSVKVAIRVRPFNQRELDLNCQLCVDMHGPTTLLKDLTDEAKDRSFTFDFSFWSHNEFAEDENGFFVATSDKYADQRTVFDQVGREVLDNAWEGYHTCLFAYGQTGAGKSYSMVGYGKNKGIVPIAMFEIFERIKKNPNPAIEYEVQFSMMEIYNERIQDLVIDPKLRPGQGLKVREHKTLGVYVEGLSKHPVDSYEAIEALMEEGNKNRTIGATIMNASSSRAHTIISIEFKQREDVGGRKTDKISVINLVDLAGSERASKTGATADRLKEGSAINTSLTVLGLVISKLAERETKGKGSVVIPYRDSALTRILQNALGGNSKTLMICAISPATDNYDETLSTLRYADQAKKIKNKAIINESEQDKMIRELKEENEKLKATLQNYSPSDPKGIIDEETFKKYQMMQEEMKANARFMEEMEKSYQERLQEGKLKAAIEREESSKKKNEPHLVNLNEDPLLTAKVFYSITKDNVHVGKKNGNPQPDIVLGGVGIQPNHAVLHFFDGECSIEPCSQEAAPYIYVNGDRVPEKRVLEHNDRVVFGTGSAFLFKYPGKEAESKNASIPDNDLDWEYAQSELLEKTEKIRKVEKEKEAETQKKLKEIEEAYIKTSNENKKIQAKYEQKIKELEKGRRTSRTNDDEFKETDYFGDDSNDKERKKKEVQDEFTKQKIIEQNRTYLIHKLAKYLSRITEANLIAKELHKDITFSVKLQNANMLDVAQDKVVKPKIFIQITNREVKRRYLWELRTFKNRYFMIKDLLEKYYETNELPKVDQEDDPFWDPPVAHTLAQAHLLMVPIGHLLDIDVDLPLINETGSIGTLKVKVIPVNENGEEIEKDKLEYIENPRELLNRRVDYSLRIEDVRFKQDLYKEVYCEYDILTSDGIETFYTEKSIEGQSNFSFNYQCHHFNKIDEKVVEFLQNHNLVIKLVGYQIEREEEIESPSPSKTGGFRAKLNKPNIKVEIDDNQNTSTQTSIQSGISNAVNSLFTSKIQNGASASTQQKGQNLDSATDIPKNMPPTPNSKKDCVIF